MVVLPSPSPTLACSWTRVTRRTPCGGETWWFGFGVINPIDGDSHTRSGNGSAFGVAASQIRYYLFVDPILLLVFVWGDRGNGGDDCDRDRANTFPE